MKRRILIALVAAALVCPPAPAAQPVRVGSRLELLVDDGLIDKMTGARRKLHRPIPCEVAIVHDNPWEGNSSGYHTVFQDGNLYRMYYRGLQMDLTGDKLKYPHRQVICYAESKDGIRWTRPELGLIEFNGSAKNNIIWDGLGSHNFAPFKDANPNCPPAARYKALGGAKNEGGLYAFQSADSIRWSLMSDKPVVTDGYFDSQNLAFWDSVSGQYREYHRDFRDGRDIKTSTSKDFLHWTKPAFLEYTGGRLTQLYTNQITPYYRAPHILLGFPTRYIAGRGLLTPFNERIARVSKRFGTDYTDGGFMTSRDGKTFTVWPEAFIRPGPLRPGQWMYGANYQNWGIVETRSPIPNAPDELSIYASEGGWVGDGNRMRRYTLRIDGFVSVNASMNGGWFVTRPLVFDPPTGKRTRPKPPPNAGPVFIDASKPIRGKRSLVFRKPATITLPGTRNLGDQVTLAVHVRDVPAGHRRLFSAYNGGPTKPKELYFDVGADDGAIRFEYDGTAAKADAALTDRWNKSRSAVHHIAATWDDGVITIYFDGKPVAHGGKKGLGPITLQLGDVRFAEDYPPASLTNEPFLGAADDILVLRRVLNAKEIESLAAKGAVGVIRTDADDGVLYDMEDDQGSRIADKLAHDKAAHAVLPGPPEPGDVELVINYATSAAGSVQCEILDKAGKPIPGFSLAEADEIYGDHIERPVTWRKSSELKDLAGKPVRLRFVLKDADLYSFRFRN